MYIEEGRSKEKRSKYKRLECERPCFALQKADFYSLKGHLSDGKRRSFGKPLVFRLLAAVCLCLPQRR